jgi:hypothetical protein
MSVGDDTGTSRRRAALGVVAALAALGAVILGLVAVTGGDPEPVTQPDAAVVSAPSTVAPLVTYPIASDDAPTSTVHTAPSNGASNRASNGAGLASRLPARTSAIPTPVSPRPTPIGVQISSIDVSGFPIRAVGLEPDGQLEVPGADEIGWYRHGSSPGRGGTTVLAAHVSWQGRNGPFARLGAVEPGDQIEVTTDDGGRRVYVVVERALYGKLALPGDRLWRTAGDETLALITCGGEYDPTTRRYRENIVVYAVPIG